jgi:hypothetical protein
MKTCPYCGAEYPDDALVCPIDQTPFERPADEIPSSSPPSPTPEPNRPEYELAPLSEDERQQDLVTLVRCGTLVAADLVVARLRAGGIEAFLPGECLMQTIGWNLNTYGFVRVQISPRDYAAAKDLLESLDSSGRINEE